MASRAARSHDSPGSHLALITICLPFSYPRRLEDVAGSPGTVQGAFLDPGFKERSPFEHSAAALFGSEESPVFGADVLSWLAYIE